MNNYPCSHCTWVRTFLRCFPMRRKTFGGLTQSISSSARATTRPPSHFQSVHAFVKLPLAHADIPRLSCQSSARLSGFHILWPQKLVRIAFHSCTPPMDQTCRSCRWKDIENQLVQTVSGGGLILFSSSRKNSLPAFFSLFLLRSYLFLLSFVTKWLTSVSCGGW